MRSIKLIVILLFIAVMPFQIFAAETISIRSDLWMPYNGDPQSESPGFMIEIAKQVFEPQGYKVDYAVMPWSRAISEARSGLVTAVVGAIKTDVPDFLFPVNEQGTCMNVWFVKKGNAWRYSDWKSLKTEKIGVIRDYSYGEKIDEAIKKNLVNVQRLSGETALEQNIKKLLAGRISVTVENRLVMKYKLRQMHLEGQLEEAGSENEIDPCYIAFSPANPMSRKYARILSEGMERMRGNGELKKILDKYGFKDWK